MIVTPGPMLEQIPFVLSVAFGVSKSPVVCAAIRGEWSMVRSRTRVSPGHERHYRAQRGDRGGTAGVTPLIETVGVARPGEQHPAEAPR